MKNANQLITSIVLALTTFTGNFAQGSELTLTGELTPLVLNATDIDTLKAGPGDIIDMKPPHATHATITTLAAAVNATDIDTLKAGPGDIIDMKPPHATHATHATITTLAAAVNATDIDTLKAGPGDIIDMKPPHATHAIV